MNPCLSCGACCAMFCVAFEETEADDIPGGYVPAEMTLLLDRHRRAMKGTLGAHPRCIALSGTIGSKVTCGIYGRRPQICRRFNVSWKGGYENSLCDRARSVYGLVPFSPF